MHKGLWLVALGVLLVLPMVAAHDTSITITTHPSTLVMVRAFEAGTAINIQTFQDTEVGDDGVVTFDLSSEASDLDLEVYVKLVRNGPAFIYKKFEDVKAGEPFTETVMRGVPNEEVSEETTTQTNATEENSTLVAEETITEIDANSTNALTGHAISGFGTGAFKSYYLWIAILAAGLIAGGAMFTRARKRKQHGLDYTPVAADAAPATTKVQSPEEQLSLDTLDSLRTELETTKGKLKQANTEISKIQNKERINTLEKNIKEEEAELLRLRQEDSVN